MKNNLTTKLLFSICIFTLINCTSKNNLKENGGIKVDLDSKETTSIFDIFSKIEVIPLETKKEALIVYNPVINSFNIKNDTLFVHCGKSQDVTLFNLANGSFIERLIFLGNGPGEYVTLTDFKINEYTNTLDFLTPQGELLIYDSNDKKQFKDSYQIPVMAVHNFLPISPDGYICSNSSTIKPLLFFSKKDNKVEEFNYTLPEHILTTSYGISSVPYYMYGDTIMFRESFSGNIYSLDTTNYTLKERFVWDFMNHQFDLSLIPEGKNAIEIFKLSREISMNYASQFAPPAENDKYIIMPFYYKNNGWVLIYNKEKKEVKAFSKFKEGIQLDRGIISDNALYVLTDPSILNLFTNLSVLDIKNQNIVANINKDEDNLVVLKYTFK